MAETSITAGSARSTVVGKGVRVALLPIGVAVVWFALVTLGPHGAQIQAPVVAAGLLACWFGIDAALVAVFGRRVETGVWLSAAWVAAVVLAAVFADLLPLAEAQDVSKTLTTPTRLRPDLFSAHPLGTDVQGLDILGGVIYGARVSLQVGLLAVIIGTVLGGLIGVAAGYFGGRLDAVAGLATDSLLAFPPLILLLAVVSAVDPGVIVISASLAVLGIPTYIRLARANTLTFAQREFVMAARALGARPSRHHHAGVGPQRDSAGAVLFVHHHRGPHRRGGLAELSRGGNSAAHAHLGEHDLGRPGRDPDLTAPGLRSRRGHVLDGVRPQSPGRQGP